jgi:hypothetical protein
MNAPMANGDDQWPECDPEYIKALGRAVYNFAVLEISVVWIMEHFKPGYLGEYGSQEKTAGTLAREFTEVTRHEKGHAAAAELTANSKSFGDLKERRNKLLHANPAIMVIDGQLSHGLHYQAQDILWDIHTVRQAAVDFAAAAEQANVLLKNLIMKP